MSLAAFACPDQREAKKCRVSERDSRINSKNQNEKTQQLSLPIDPTPPSRNWAIGILPIPPAQAIAPERYWLVCSSWRYPLQFKPEERNRLRALLLEYGWLDWAIDEDRECPRCIDVLHQAIEFLVDCPDLSDRGEEV